MSGGSEASEGGKNSTSLCQSVDYVNHRPSLDRQGGWEKRGNADRNRAPSAAVWVDGAFVWG